MADRTTAARNVRIWRWPGVAAALLAATGAAEGARAEPVFEAIALPHLAGVRHGLNADGTALGYAPLPGGGGRGPALVYRDGRIRVLELLGPGATPAALNDAADVAVDIQPGGPCRTEPAEIVCTRHATVWQAGRLRDLGTLGGPRSFARTLDGAGTVAGWSDLDRPTGAATGPAFIQRGFVHAGGRMVELPTLGGLHSRALAMNATGEIAGWAEDAEARHRAVVWRTGTVNDLGTLGGTESEAQAIGVRGHVAGWSRDAAGRRRAFLWRNGRMVDLGTLGGAESEATVIGASGNIVSGWGENAAGERRAFFWWDGNMLDLTALVAPGFATPDEPAIFSEVVAINDRMELVATLSGGSASAKSRRFVRHVLLVRRGGAR